MSGYLADCLFVIDPDIYDPDKGYQLAAIWPGFTGIVDTDFYCGHDLELAMEYANDLNYENGHTPSFVTTVLEMVSGLDKIKYYNA